MYDELCARRREGRPRAQLWYISRENRSNSSECHLQPVACTEPGGKPDGQLMSDAVVQRASAVEYFRDLVEGAMAHQHVNAGELTAYYLVHLLASFTQRTDAGEPLALELIQALEAGAFRQRTTLREIGDRSLFLSGFFSESLKRKLVDVDYYVSIGGFAYTALTRVETDHLSPVFAELAKKFAAFVDVLSEVSERTSLTSNADLLRLYEKWLKTGSRRSGQLLAERGVFPASSPTTHRIQ